MSSTKSHLALLVEEYEELLNSIPDHASREHEQVLLISTVAAGRDLLEAYELYKQPGSLDKGALYDAVIANKQLFNQAQERYFKFIGSGTTQRTQEVVGIFDPFVVNAADGSSSHASKTAEYKFLFFRSKYLAPLAASFQKTCMQDMRVADSRFRRCAPASSRLEDPFVDQIVDEMAPRLQVVLESIIGLQNVSVQKLHKNSGTDVGLTAYSGKFGKLTIYLPIEVRNRFGAEAPQNRVPRENGANFTANREQVESLCSQTGGLNVESLWHGLTQTAHYMENGMPKTNYGVLIAKNAMFLLWRVASERILVSDAVSYTSANPHPVAMISFFVATMLRHPSASLNSSLFPTFYALQSLDERNDSANPSRPDSDASGSIRGSSSYHSQMLGFAQEERRQGRGAGSIPSGFSGRGRFDTATEAMEHGNSTDGLSTMCGSVGKAGIKQESPYEYTGLLERSLDLGCIHMEKFLKWRSHVFYGRWHDGQAVAIKAGLVSDEENIEELVNELAVYFKLRHLQGSILPRLIDYGCTTIGGKRYAALVLEWLDDPSLHDESVPLDKRPIFKQLKTCDKVACVNALGIIHRHGIAHKDIRGANILFRHSHGGRRIPVFIDFGFAHWATREKEFAEYKANDYLNLMEVFKMNGHKDTA